MFLYQLEVTLSDRTASMIVLADTDDKAFDYAEVQLAKHYIAMPVIKELVIMEKKRADRGAGYVVETAL